MNKIISFLGLPGSWKWACKQMQKGLIVRPKSATGTVKYKLDDEGQERIMWSFEKHPISRKDWQNAFIFLSDFKRTDWVIFELPW